MSKINKGLIIKAWPDNFPCYQCLYTAGKTLAECTTHVSLKLIPGNSHSLNEYKDALQ